MPPHRSKLVATLGVAALAIGAAAELDPANARLRSMPLEHRQALSRQLQVFDRLPRSEQDSLRKLDAAVEAAPPESRARYVAVARRYHLWLRTLPDADRTRLAQGDAEQRIGVLRTLLAEHPIHPNVRLDEALARTTTLNSVPIFNQAHWIRIWLRLSPEQKTSVEKVRPPDRINRLEELGRAAGITDERPALLQRYEADTQKRLSEARNPRLAKTFDTLKPQAKKDIVYRGVEARFLQNYRPAAVKPPQLERFVRAIPSWLREMLDPLPPRAAKQRLNLLYRLVYPEPDEIPDNTPAADKSSPADKTDAKSSTGPAIPPGSASPF